nr:hypothetical protein [Candidatus Freyarchaeota archaeon]
MEKKDTTKYVEDVGKVFKNIEDHVKQGGGEGGKGSVTMGTVRKTLELAKTVKSYLEFKMRFGYMVARNIPEKGKSHLGTFYKNLTEISEGKDLEYLKTLMEYVVMSYTVLSKKLE